MAASGLTVPEFQKTAGNEFFVLKRFRELGDDHLIRAIAYYTQGGGHYFVFPWANGGNLRDFWSMKPSLSPASLDIGPQDWCDHLKWVFTQLAGIARGIKMLHIHNNNEESLRHGDLKPENVLFFCRQIPSPGKAPTGVTLVIGDVGLAKVHQKVTEMRGEKTGTQTGTTRYSPPEAEVQSHLPRTRRYDIWSLACIYLEFAIWLLYGNDGLETFSEALGEGKPFYEKAQVIEVKSVV